MGLKNVERGRKDDFEMKVKLTWVILIILMMGTAGCDLFASPDKTVNSFLTAVEKTDFETASQYVKQTDTTKAQFDKANNPEGEKIIQAVFSKVSHKTLSSTKTQNTAQVVTSITSLDMYRISTSVMSDLIPMAFASAFSEGTNSDNTDQMVEQMFMNALGDPNAPMTTQQVTINLIKENGKWLIVWDDSLTNALTGNLSKFAEAFTSSFN